MDDPQLQRAIYASIQTARSQGYSLSSGKGAGQSIRPSLQPARGSGGGAGRHGAAIHRSTPSGASVHPPGNSHRNQTQRPQPQPQSRSYAGNSLPGMGAAAAAASVAATGASSNSLRASFGRIEALRRDGIVPASAGPAYPHQHQHPHQRHSHAQAHPGGPPCPGSPSIRALPSSVPPRATPSPQRLRNQTQQQQQQPQTRQRQGHSLSLQTAAATHRMPNPVLEAIAAVTSDAQAAADAAAVYGIAAAAAAVSPLTVTPLSPSGRAPPAQPHCSPTGAGGGGGGAAAGAAGGAAPVVGGCGPPPRALVPVAAPGGSVMMVPEGVDPVLAQAVLRDAVTWETGVTFDDIAGCDRAKQLLHEAVALPLIIPEFFTGIREPWRGVLLHGPPGNGKTMLAKAVAGMVGGAFFAVSPASLTSKWRGESEKLLAALFAVAQAHAPAIIFIDEVDALGGARGGEGEHEASRRFKAELLQQMDGLASGRGVMVLAATNCPWDLDPALRRRLEKRIHIGLPDAAQRLALLQLHLRGLDLAPDVDLPALAAACEGFSGADIRLLCRDAAMAPLRRQLGGLATPGSNAPSPPQPPQPQQQQQQRPSPSPPSSAAAQPSGQPHSQSYSQQQPQSQLHPQPQPLQPLVLRSAADIRRLADSGELARGAVVAAADLEAARGSVRPSVAAEQAARYVAWDQEFAST